jgi:pimeloyl-ACP methyl ester carboxylesterase
MLAGAMTITGTAAGVPYVALPPEGDGPAPLVAVWHLLDAPRSEAAMAAAVPMAGVPAWRVYFGMPMFGERALPGGMDELLRLASEDYVLNVAKPIVDQAAAEFPAALADLRAQLSIKDGSVGIAGGSMGGLVAYEILARGEVPVSAAALVNPVTSLALVVRRAHQQLFGTDYTWTDASRAAADHFDFVRRAEEIDVPTLVVIGLEDDIAFRAPAAELGDRVELVTLPGMKHAIADEPGLEAAPQNADAKRVDAEFTRWFRQHL